MRALLVGALFTFAALVPAWCSQVAGGLSAEQREQIHKAAVAYFNAGDAERGSWKFDAGLDALLLKDEPTVRRAVWQAFQSSNQHAKIKKDFDDHLVRSKNHVSPYVVKAVGKMPEKGWPLVIAMHGGGGVAKEVNDSQWKHMQIYYKDQPAAGGYLYLALRAPNDVWNGFYDEYVPPLITQLIRQYLVFGDVDPDKVFLIGYSHGGYGAFYIGPKIPDRFAAVHASASAPTAGRISPLNLRNTHFSFMVGEHDTAYGRRKLCESFDATIQKLKKNEKDKDAFPVTFEFKKGFGHGGLPDRDKLKELLPLRRNPRPKRLTWEMTDAVVRDFFWLSSDKPGPGCRIDAAIAGNSIDITTEKVDDFYLDLDSRLIPLITEGRPFKLTLNGKSFACTLQPSFATLCQSMLRRGDPESGMHRAVTPKRRPRFDQRQAPLISTLQGTHQ